MKACYFSVLNNGRLFRRSHHLLRLCGPDAADPQVELGPQHLGLAVGASVADPCRVGTTRVRLRAEDTAKGGKCGAGVDLPNEL